jgi:hypothetical protein
LRERRTFDEITSVLAKPRQWVAIFVALLVFAFGIVRRYSDYVMDETHTETGMNMPTTDNISAASGGAGGITWEAAVTLRPLVVAAAGTLHA